MLTRINRLNILITLPELKHIQTLRQGENEVHVCRQSDYNSERSLSAHEAVFEGERIVGNQSQHGTQNMSCRLFRILFRVDT